MLFLTNLSHRVLSTLPRSVDGQLATYAVRFPCRTGMEMCWIEKTRERSPQPDGPQLASGKSDNDLPCTNRHWCKRKRLTIGAQRGSTTRHSSVVTTTKLVEQPTFRSIDFERSRRALWRHTLSIQNVLHVLQRFENKRFCDFLWLRFGVVSHIHERWLNVQSAARKWRLFLNTAYFTLASCSERTVNLRGIASQIFLAPPKSHHSKIRKELGVTTTLNDQLLPHSLLAQPLL